MVRNTGSRIYVGKVPFANTSPTEAAGTILAASRQKQPLSVRLSNAYCVALASKDSSYEELLNGHGVNYPDGTPVVWFMRLLSRSAIPGRVRGPSLFKQVLKASSEDGTKHYFLGTTDATLNSLTSKLKQQYPDIQIAGQFSPPFGAIDEKFLELCQNVCEESKPDLVWVALGTPKQDFVASALSIRLNRPCVAVGAAFDFLAGTAKEAPEWIQSSGMEWAYRLFSEPRRLWRRYIFGNARFLYSATFQSNYATKTSG